MWRTGKDHKFLYLLGRSILSFSTRSEKAGAIESTHLGLSMHVLKVAESVLGRIYPDPHNQHIKEKGSVTARAVTPLIILDKRGRRRSEMG